MSLEVGASELRKLVYGAGFVYCVAIVAQCLR